MGKWEKYIFIFFGTTLAIFGAAFLALGGSCLLGSVTSFAFYMKKRVGFKLF